jgi:hypothetical protein
MLAKQRYYNSFTPGAWRNLQEKVAGEMTLYGLPMLQVSLPNTTTTPPGQIQAAAHESVVSRQSSTAAEGAGQVTSTTLHLALDYTPHTIDGLGTYYTVSGSHDVQAVDGYPVEPQIGIDIYREDGFAHGVLMAGGTFTDIGDGDGIGDFDPYISVVVTDDTYSQTEPTFPTGTWYPVHPATINRFLAINGPSREQLIIMPGQFQATTAAPQTMGIQRLYTDLELVVYHAPLTATDFIAPSIWQAEAISTSFSLTFRILVEDNSGAVERAVVLYRLLDQNTWSKAELTYDAGSGWAHGTVPPVNGQIEYFVQAVDPTGNVALALDHGNPFRRVTDKPLSTTYLPVINNDYVYAPDLVVERILATSDSVQVVVKNQGSAPVVDSFWVDAYINPDPVPTRVNQLWTDLADEGLVWAVATRLEPGDTITLTNEDNDPYYRPDYSLFSGALDPGTWIYVQVDSASTETDYGGVLEDHEIRHQTYNNISSVRLTASVMRAENVDTNKTGSPQARAEPSSIVPSLPSRPKRSTKNRGRPNAQLQ